jgi:hypothetical protein
VQQDELLDGGMGAAGFRDDSSGMDMGIIFCLSVAPVFDLNRNGYEMDIFSPADNPTVI